MINKNIIKGMIATTALGAIAFSIPMTTSVSTSVATTNEKIVSFKAATEPLSGAIVSSGTYAPKEVLISVNVDLSQTKAVVDGRVDGRTLKEWKDLLTAIEAVAKWNEDGSIDSAHYGDGVEVDTTGENGPSQSAPEATRDYLPGGAKYIDPAIIKANIALFDTPSTATTKNAGFIPSTDWINNFKIAAKAKLVAELTKVGRNIDDHTITVLNTRVDQLISSTDPSMTEAEATAYINKELQAWDPLSLNSGVQNDYGGSAKDNFCADKTGQSAVKYDFTLECDAIDPIAEYTGVSTTPKIGLTYGEPKVIAPVIITVKTTPHTDIQFTKDDDATFVGAVSLDLLHGPEAARLVEGATAAELEDEFKNLEEQMADLERDTDDWTTIYTMVDGVRTPIGAMAELQAAQDIVITKKEALES